MRKSILLIPLLTFMLAACASVPEESAEGPEEAKKPDGKVCAEEKGYGNNSREPVKVCREH